MFYSHQVEQLSVSRPAPCFGEFQFKNCSQWGRRFWEEVAVRAFLQNIQPVYEGYGEI
jgi:hypothetical protein